MLHVKTAFIFCIFYTCLLRGQLPVARDTISVIENNRVLKMPWSNGINYCNISAADLNADGKKDLVVFDRQNLFSIGRFRCFINQGNFGEIKYNAEPSLSYAFPEIANWALLLDYDKDGKADIFSWTSGGIKVYKNISSQNTVPSFSLVQALLKSNYTPTANPSISNIYASPVGVPGIADLDNDGDLDILTFSPQGSVIEFHKNMSQELYQHSDSLVFEIGDNCWGNISENDCTVNLQACHSRFSSAPQQKPLHAGSCLMCFDSDGDGDQDVLLGDVSCNSMQYIHNGGNSTSALITDTTQLYPNYPLKNNSVNIRINNFPCSYNLDVDNDGKKDLIAAPNANNSENYKSLWLYRNSSLTNTVNFQFVKNNFLQDEMIEVGQNSFPVMIDYDGDGLKDLLIGTFGYYQNNSLKGRLTLYRNIGTLSLPVYSLITRDYANLSTYNLNFVMPAVGDVDGDGDIDICVGVSSGQIHWLVNTAGVGNPCNFSQFKINPFSFTTNSGVAAPQLFDFDNDGKLDLIIGTKNGRLAWYKNTGPTGAPTFSLMTNFLGGVDVKGNSNQYGLDGYAVPYFYREGAELKLLVGSVNGSVFYYSVPTSSQVFQLINNKVNGLNEGGQSTVCYEDINNDGKRDLLLGNASGGLSFFSSASAFVGMQEHITSALALNVKLFPNPGQSVLHLKFSETTHNNVSMWICDLLGNKVLEDQVNTTGASINISTLPRGLYFIHLSQTLDGTRLTTTKKFIAD